VVRAREDAGPVVALVFPAVVGAATALLTGLPASAWVRLRPSGVTAFAETVVQASGAGVLTFALPVAGAYRAELVGRWRGGPWDFTAV
jgi:hypothetical protein